MDKNFLNFRFLWTVLALFSIDSGQSQQLQSPSFSRLNPWSPEEGQSSHGVLRNPIYDFATNLYLSVSQLKSDHQNMLISPFSIRTITALIYLASRGETAQEIREALLFPSSHDDLVDGLAKHMSSTKTLQSSKFDVGNGIFLREGAHLNRTYSEIVRTKLFSDVQTCNFLNPQSAAVLINSWVSTITKNRIKKLVDGGSLSPATSVFMANALYFSGQWSSPFDETSTRPGTFTLDNGQTTTVQMMQIEYSFNYNYIRALRATGISIPFRDSRFEFIILKPDGKLNSLESALSKYPLNQISSEIKKQTRNVLFRMPKFRLDVHYDLVDVMEKLGIKSLFNVSKGDLSGLTKTGDRHTVSQIVHQTALDVSEKGADAAAGTSVSFYPISSPSFFTVDKPFLFLLNDRLTGPVFIGRLANPDQARIHVDSAHSKLHFVQDKTH